MHNRHAVPMASIIIIIVILYYCSRNRIRFIMIQYYAIYTLCIFSEHNHNKINFHNVGNICVWCRFCIFDIMLCRFLDAIENCLFEIIVSRKNFPFLWVCNKYNKMHDMSAFIHVYNIIKRTLSIVDVT